MSVWYDRLDDLPRNHLQRLPVPLVHGEQEEWEHGHDHAEGGRAGAGRLSEQEEQRRPDERRRPKTHKLPFGEPKHHLAFYFC